MSHLSRQADDRRVRRIQDAFIDFGGCELVMSMVARAEEAPRGDGAAGREDQQLGGRPGGQSNESQYFTMLMHPVRWVETPHAQ